MADRISGSSNIKSIEMGIGPEESQIKLFWTISEKPITIPYFPVWENRVLRKVPATGVKNNGGKWIVSAGIKTEKGAWDIKDVIAEHGNTLEISREWQWKGGLIGNVHLGMDVYVPFSKLDFWAIPFISMNGNHGSSIVPCGMSQNEEPWMFREERTTAPGLVTIEENGMVAGSYTEPGKSEKLLCSCSVMPADNGHVMRALFPYMEGPLTFFGTGYNGHDFSNSSGVFSYGSNGGNGLIVNGTAKFRRKFYIVMDRVCGIRHGYVKVWESAWRNLKEPIANNISLKKTEKLLWDSLDYFWVKKGSAQGYSLRIDSNGAINESWAPVLGTGWCAPTFMLAYLGIRRAIKAGKTSPASKPVLAAEYFIRNAKQDSGVFLTSFDIRHMKWGEGPLDAVQLGGASYWILRCVRLLKDIKLFNARINIKEWTDFAIGFCDLALKTQLPDGAYGAAWDIQGKCLGTERAMGIHAGRAILEAYRLTGDIRYLESAEKGADYYINYMVDKEAGYGDCTDLSNSTTENDGAGVPDFLLDLYRETGKKPYLDKAIRSAEYCLSFMYTYNMYFPPETECGRRKMLTKGSSAISPETGFISFWFAHQANIFLELWKETKDARWKEYAVAVIRGTLQMMSEHNDTFGLAPHLIGCRAEVLPMLDTIKGVHIWKKGMTGYTWHQPVWWPAAFNLTNIAVIEDNFPELLREFKDNGGNK